MGQRLRASRDHRRRSGRPPAGRSVVVSLALVALAAVTLAACSSGGGGSSGAVTVIRPSLTQTQNCATTASATWMGCLVSAQSGFGNTPLSQVSLPGAYNAATNGLDPQSFDVTPGSACTDYRKSLLQQGEAIDRWYSAQDESLGQELDQGVRFLDLQVAYNGIPQPQFDWRVVNTLFSELPLADYLGQIATWAQAHPHEVVVVDFRNVCYEKALAPAERDLWADLAKAAPGSVSLADVAYDASKAPSGGLGTTTIDDVVQQNGGGHNVVLLMPDTVRQQSVLTGTEHVHPFFTTPASGSGSESTSGTATVAYTPTKAVPIDKSVYTTANHQIESQADNASPPIGSLAGKGLYLSPIAYDLSAASVKTEETLFLAFGGLITPAVASLASPPAWESGLWAGAFPRNAIAAAWGHRANVVLGNGVEYAGFVPAVIDLNGAGT